MNEKDEAFEEITVPTTETVAAPLGTGSSAVESAVDAANFDDGIVAKIGKYRWMICALLFFATTINYIDRQVLGILATDDAFKAQIGWNEAEYGFVNTAFQAAYAIGLLVVGIGGMAGSIGGMLIASTVGLILEFTKSSAFPNGNYFSIFVIAGSAYLTALLIMHLLAPKLEQVDLGKY